MSVPMKNEPLKVWIVASEITPYAKSGGLGDVIGSLPKELKKCGVDVRVVFPKYRTIRENLLQNLSYVGSFNMSLGWRNQGASIYTIDADVKTYLIENDFYFGRDGFYGYGDDYERFAFFSKASLECLNMIDFIPDVIHFNDWQTGLGCVYAKGVYGKYIFCRNAKTLYTVHNLQYQGVFGRSVLSDVGLNDGYFTNDKLEFHGNTSYMKAGLVYADAISTVSETYALEIQTPGYGHYMDGVLRSRRDSLYGILNGIDTTLNDPETDPRLYENYSLRDCEGKKKNKRALQQQLGLPQRDVPMIGIISRLVDQKGFDLIYLAMEELIHKDLQIVVLGTGDGRYEHLFLHTAWRMPDKVSANIYFSDDLAQKIYASADMFLMPSLFEPCGLGQLFAMRYGTVPVVRKTGGLADTVTHFNGETKTGNGFVFESYDARGMMWAVNEALHAYSQGEAYWNTIVKNAMACDFSWKKSAEKYIALYSELAGRKYTEM